MKKVISDSRVPIKIWTNEIEAEAEGQLRNVANLPFIYKHVAVMPDAHAGKGSTVGTVIATSGAIIPAAVGVDIGCGMCAVALPFKAEFLGDLKKLRHSIERDVPVGFAQHSDPSERQLQAFAALGDIQIDHPAGKRDSLLKKASLQLGTLGGGNHFIEICSDQHGMAWILLHSGSRNIGKCLAEIHIDRAKTIMRQYFIGLPDEDLSYLVQGTAEFKAYMHDLLWAQSFAKANRNEMMLRVLKNISHHVYAEEHPAGFLTKQRIDCHHNYSQMENHFGKNVWVTRKGAVSAREGELGIIPGSMGTKSYIVEGLGNEESFCSCSHGAGRRMSRTKARASFKLSDLENQTKGVECRKDDGVLDEIPGAYKSIDEVMENQKDLVRPIFELKQLICIKG